MMKYYFIGDQGISMSALKKYLAEEGNQVDGSDLKTTGHSAKNITKDIDFVVRTSAVKPGSKGWSEVEAAEKFGIKVIKRSELLGEITKRKKLIAISGMHGKTTVASMTGLVLIAAGLDPTVLVGANVAEFGGEAIRIGQSDLWVAEICEYDRSFLDIYPKIVILTNIDKEHLDTFPGGLPEIKEAFIEYLNHIPDKGVIIACVDDPNVSEVLSKLTTKAKIITYGFTSKDYNKISFELKIPGKHNILNALAVVALADYFKINPKLTTIILSNFRGAKRRFEKLGTYNGCDLIDDYGHHPTEIKTTLAALKDTYPGKNKIVVFWPHQYKRILPLLQEFGGAFEDADEVILKPIYFVPGRDEELPVASEDIIRLIKSKSAKIKATVMNSDQEIATLLRGKIGKKDVVLTIGIPPVYKITEEIMKN
jgi:UDP-N-acetylmuramate--alanine ligase